MDSFEAAREAFFSTKDGTTNIQNQCEPFTQAKCNNSPLAEAAATRVSLAVSKGIVVAEPDLP